MSVNHRQKIVLIPKLRQSAKKLFGVTLAHEIEGHVLQAENKELLPLKICEKVGSGDSTIFAEGGAKWNEDYVSETAFGFGAPARPHYIRAMVTKLEGGNFSECVATYHTSMNESLIVQRDAQEITQAEFIVQAEKNLTTAYKSVLRLFKYAESLAAKNTYLTNSKDTIYAEQTLLAHELHEAGLSQYLMVGGASTDTLILLKKLDLLDDRKIRQSDHYALTLWEQEKNRFQLDMSTSTNYTD